MKITSSELKPVTSTGEKFLGGVDFDEALAKYFAQQFEEQHNIYPLNDLRTYQDFRDKAEEAKKHLSSDTEAYIGLSAEGKILDLTLTREQFNELISHFIEQTLGLTQQALKDAKMEWKEIDRLLLVGGSTRIPLVQERIKEISGKEPETGISPDEVVAIGAAYMAAEILRKKSIPVPILRDEESKPLSLPSPKNITAHSLGIIVKDNEGKDINSKIIKKDSEIQAEGKGGYTTIEDNQTVVEIQVVQGEDDNPEYCDKVGDALKLSGIPPMPKDEPKIEVTMKYDNEGTIHFSAKELKSGVELTTQISHPALLSKDKVNELKEKVGKLRTK